MKLISSLSAVRLEKDNTEIVKRHCSDCEQSNQLGRIGTPEDCPLRGTFHGELVPVSKYTKLNFFKRLFSFFDRYTLTTHNTITNVGHAAANGRISNQGSYNAFVNIAIGTGTQGTPATATALATETTTGGGGRGAATATQVTTTVTNDTTQLVKTFTFTASFSITEEGIFDNAVSGGSMLAYQTFTAIAVNSGDQLQITHKYQS